MRRDSSGSEVLSGEGVAVFPARVVAVFADDSAEALRTLRHVRAGASLPVWLYCTQRPSEAVFEAFDRVVVQSSQVRLLATAHRELWPRRTALAAGSWTGGPASLLKILPLFLPPFRAVFLNDSGDFVPGTPGHVAAHIWRRIRERLHDVAVRSAEIAADTWELLTYHIWRSATVNRIKDRAAAAGLLAIATALRLCGYPQRRLFHRIHGDAAMDIPVAASQGSETVIVRQTDHHWDPEAIRAAVASTARWMVWHEGKTEDTIDDLLPLFSRPETFAISRQSSYRAWKSCLLPTAPFRPLQPGEYAQVTAPLGSTIVVDLAKLRALGVPDASHPITAWMVLFWKAAAAGWKSYSAGTTKTVGPEVDYPSGEAAFFLSVVAKPALRALGPRDPLLSRGNIAFSLHASTHASRPRVLVVSPFLPYPLSHGGAVRIYNLCRQLAGRVDFALVAVRENRETIDYARLHEVFTEVRIVDIDQTAPMPGDPPEQARQHECPAFRAAIANLCREWTPDLVQFEYTQIAALRDAAGSIPSILVEHDITQSLYRQLAESGPSRRSRREHRRWRDFENHWLARYEGVWTVSESDRAIAIEAGRRSPERTYAVANGVDTERFRPEPQPDGPPEILYVGSFRHLPNIIAFERLRTAIMPLVWQRLPQAVLRVVAGPRHQYFWERFDPESRKRKADPRIVVHDFVEDLRPLYARATAVAAPLQVSAGTNIKIMEAMACGRAIVSTPTGCAGLELEDGRDLLIRRSETEFAAALCDLLDSPAFRHEIASIARRTTESRFSWTAIADEAWRSYQSLAPIRAQPGQTRSSAAR